MGENGVPALSVELRHLEAFTLALKRAAETQPLHHSELRTIPHPQHMCLQRPTTSPHVQPQTNTFNKLDTHTGGTLGCLQISLTSGGEVIKIYRKIDLL